MKFQNTIAQFMLPALVAVALLGGQVIQSDIIVAAGAGGGPHIRVFDGSEGGLIYSGESGGLYEADAEDEDVDDFVDEGSDSNEQASGVSDPEWRYVPVRR